MESSLIKEETTGDLNYQDEGDVRKLFFQFCCEGKGDEAEQKKRWAEAIAFQDERYLMRLNEKTDGAVAGKLIMGI